MHFVLLIIIPAFLWGATNPLLRKYSTGIEDIKAESFLLKSYLEIKFLFTNFKVICQFKFAFFF